ncbi:hypothetical protein Tco_1088006 [Tanacetum coccineum]
MARLWWPQPARPPPQRWRQAAEHREAPRGVTPPQPDTTWCGCGGCTVGCIAGCGGRSATHGRATAAAAAGKAAAVVVVPAVVRRRGGGEGVVRVVV